MNRIRLQPPGKSYNVATLLRRADHQGVDLNLYGSGVLPRAIDRFKAGNASLRQVAEVHYLEMARQHYAVYNPSATVQDRPLWQAYESADEIVMQHMKRTGQEPSKKALEHMQAYREMVIPRLRPDLIQDAIWLAHRQDPDLLDLPVLTIIDSATRLNKTLESFRGEETMLPYDLGDAPGSCNNYDADRGIDIVVPNHVALLGHIQWRLQFGVTLFAQFDDVVITQVFPLWLQDALIQLGIADTEELAALATIGLQDPAERFVGMMLHNAFGIFFDFGPDDYELEGHSSAHESALNDLDHQGDSIFFGIDEDIYRIMRPVYDYLGHDRFVDELLHGDGTDSDLDQIFRSTFHEFIDGLPLTGGRNLQAWHHRAGTLLRRQYDSLISADEE
jgi:hypothetical protein